MNFPVLKEEIDWTPVADWPVVLLHDVWDTIPIKGKEFVFLSRGREFGRLSSNGSFVIRKGYACDGFSPVLKVFGKFVRLTPTPKSGMWSSIRHDFFRQFADVPNCPWGRKDTDTWFYNDLVRGGMSSSMAGTYYGAVAGKAGDLFLALTRKSKDHLCVIERKA